MRTFKCLSFKEKLYYISILAIYPLILFCEKSRKPAKFLHFNGKRMTASILTVCFMLPIMCLNTFSAASATSVSIGEVLLNSATPYYVNGTATASGTLGEGGCTAYLDASTGTLTLKDFSTTDNVCAPAYDLIVVLEGINTITTTDMYGLGDGFYHGNITVKGDGQLSVSAEDRAISTVGTVTIESGTVIATSDNIGIVGGSGVIINSGNITAIGKTYGIDCYGYMEGIVTINGGVVISQSTSTGKAYDKAVKVTNSYKYRTADDGSYTVVPADATESTRSGAYYEVQVSDSVANPSIILSVNGIQDYDSVTGYDYIYYGKDGTNPIKWRVLDDKTNTGTNGLFLLSEDLLGTGEWGGVHFNQSSPYDNDYQESVAQDWCNTFESTNLSANELDSIIETTKSDMVYQSSTNSVIFADFLNILDGDKVFFLSAEEVEKADYGFSNDAERVAYYGSIAGVWWLRSPFYYNSEGAGCVDDIGSVDAWYVYSEMTARPAFNLDKNRVLFSSAAVNGKAIGTLKATIGYSGNEWKTTVLDASRSFAVTEVSATAKPGETVTINYMGANTGANEYVSAMIVDESDKVLYYGQIANNYAQGQAQIIIPADLACGNYTVNLFSEQLNGDKMTDYASAFDELALTVEAHSHSWDTAWDNNNTHHWHNCSSHGCEITDNSQKDGYTVHTPEADDGDCTTDVLCSVCGAVTTPKNNQHNYKWVVDKEATASENGSKHEECTVCNKKQNENTSIPKIEEKPKAEAPNDKSPQTGKNTNLLLWIALLFASEISMLGIIATINSINEKEQ